MPKRKRGPQKVVPTWVPKVDKRVPAASTTDQKGANYEDTIKTGSTTNRE